MGRGVNNFPVQNFVSYSHQNRWCQDGDSHIDQWDRIKNPKINPYIHGQLILYKCGKANQWGKNNVFNK